MIQLFFLILLINSYIIAQDSSIVVMPLKTPKEIPKGLPNELPSGLIQQLIEIKYMTEMYVNGEMKKQTPLPSSQNKDTVMAVYQTLRYKMDGLVFSLSADMIAANSFRKIRLLNNWCLQKSTYNISHKENEKDNYMRAKKCIRVYVQLLNNIFQIYQAYIILPQYENNKAINLSTNIFYLLKDSYTILQGLSDMKTKQIMALIEILDHTRLAILVDPKRTEKLILY